MRKIKMLLLLALCLIVTAGYSQDTHKMKTIDSLVSAINHSNLPVQQDSIIQDLPGLGLYMKTYLTILMDGNELKKYVNKVNSLRQENGVSKQLIASNTFYFDRGKLIRVEEFAIGDGKEMHLDWYYSDGRPLYYTLQTDKGKERAELLLRLADAMQTQIKTMKER